MYLKTQQIRAFDIFIIQRKSMDFSLLINFPGDGQNVTRTCSSNWNGQRLKWTIYFDKCPSGNKSERPHSDNLVWSDNFDGYLVKVPVIQLDKTLITGIWLTLLFLIYVQWILRYSEIQWKLSFKHAGK